MSLIILESLVNQKIMQRLCISDLDRQQIKQMNNKIANIIDTKNVLTIKNINLKVLKY